MQPPDRLWKKYLAEAARLQEQGRISADEYYVLRHSLAAKSTLMDLTRGDESAFSEGTVQEVLAVAKESLRADLKEAVNKEQQSRRDAESQIARYEEETTLRLSKLRSKAANWAKKVRRAGLVIGATTIIVSTCYTFPWELPRPRDAWGRYSLSGILLLLLILSCAHLTWGVTLTSILDRLEQRIADKLAGRFLRFAGLEQGGSADKSTEEGRPGDA
jgi:hypothetical protein